ncbi:MAG TPA: nascent polypeptide-associated complex protein, partial [Candidatus Nanoarchaeia archaeon]|nr:nascent polypeptide-associated complex protein [Candidatus Nanoarchaeia archaeon]
PGMNARKMNKMMQRMGVQQQDIDAEQVIIKCKDKEIIINNPQVAKINLMGQQTIQIVGDIEERSLEKFNEDDVKTVMEQAEVNEDEAREALEKSNGDLAEAILSLKK